MKYSGSQKSEVCPRNPMPYAPCPMPYAQSYLIFLRKAIVVAVLLRTVREYPLESRL